LLQFFSLFSLSISIDRNPRQLLFYVFIVNFYILKDVEEPKKDRCVSQVGGEAREERWGINLAMKKHLELEIRTFQIPPKDATELRRLLVV